MPTVDLRKYNKKKPNRELTGAGDFSLIGLLNKDISFGSQALSDKKKEALYMEAGSLLQAGINLKNSLELIAADQKKIKDRALFDKIQQDVISGHPFSAALEHSGKFSPYEIYSLQIGEETGNLTEIVLDLAKFFQHKIKQRRKIISSLSYPCVVLSTSLGAVFFMLKFIVPMFGDIFKRFGGQLPWLTQQLITVSNLMEEYFFSWFLIGVLILAGVYVSRKTQQFRKIASTVILKIPVIGGLVQKVYLARFCNSMRLLINARLPLLRAIALCRQMIGFYPIEASLLIVEEEITMGSSLHQSLQQFSFYPSKMIQLIKVGEETNQLDHFFGKISDQYIDEVEYKTATLSSVMEPLIIIFLGLIVGLILISMYLPLFQMSNSFQ
jgi:type IV pilus assembly protein PilC